MRPCAQLLPDGTEYNGCDYEADDQSPDCCEPIMVVGVKQH
jgi:hypothetical protein